MSIQASPVQIVILGPKSGDDALLKLAHLPTEARIVATGTSLADIQKDGDGFAQATVLLNVNGNSNSLTELINAMPNLVWVHSLSAGVDHIKTPALFENPKITLTNAKGIFSSSLAEYSLFGMSYFAKNAPRWVRQQKEHNWEKYTVKELRGATLGVIGYGSIGQATARLARAYGMRVLALRRNPASDPDVDQMFGTDQVGELMQQSDYVVVAMALTEQTRGMVRAEHFAQAKKGQVLVNVGRGPLLDEDALIAALQNGPLAGAVLDVTTVEPLPKDSPLWDLPNVLISPHNADQTETFRHDSVVFFTENVRNFVNGKPLENVVDKTAGY